jgi:Ca-activated chloride channel family protein
MQLNYTVNPYIPVTHQRHLVYVLVEVDPGDDQPTGPNGPGGSGGSLGSASINLGLVVDASRSMSIPILTDQQFQKLRSMGMARQKTVDGVKVWQFDVPKGFHIDAPSNMDFTKEALRVVAGLLRPEDHFSLVAFAEDALLMIGSTPATQKTKLVEAVDRLDSIDLGDETYMARGMAMGHKQIQAVPGSGAAVGATRRMVVLTDGYTKDERDAAAWAQQARQAGIVVSTMGLGLDFNEELLISLADASGGESYFIEDPAEIPDAFRQELARAQSITWQDLSLTLTVPGDVTLRRAHRVRPAIAPVPVEDGILSLGNLEAGRPPAALLELIVPPRPDGAYRLAQVALRGSVAGAPTAQAIDQQDVVVRYTERPSLAEQTDPHLMSVVQAVSAFKLQSQAIEDASRGNVERATRRLRTAGERLKEMGQEDLGETMLTEAELLEKEGQMSSGGTKKLRYGTRKLR